MKNKELSIGDWVGYGQRRKAVVVWLGTDRCRILVGSITGDEIVEETYDNIDPVPLTPEILEYNGFAEAHHIYPYPTYEFRDIENCVVRVAFPKNSDKTKYTKPFIEIDSESVLIEHVNVEYVHELQRALKVGEIGKEIEL